MFQLRQKEWWCRTYLKGWHSSCPFSATQAAKLVQKHEICSYIVPDIQTTKKEVQNKPTSSDECCCDCFCNIQHLMLLENQLRCPCCFSATKHISFCQFQGFALMTNPCANSCNLHQALQHRCKRKMTDWWGSDDSNCTVFWHLRRQETIIYRFAQPNSSFRSY